MEFIKKILIEASFEGDKKTSDTAKNILDELRSKINAGKGTRNNLLYFIKIGELSFYLYDYRSKISQKNLASHTYAGFSPKRDDPAIYSYRNKISNYKNNKIELDLEYVYHEIIHYLDFKRSKEANKDKSHVARGAEMQSNSKTREAADYYNNPVEFNAHFMQYVFPNIQNLISGNNAPSNFNEFRNAIVNGSKGSKMFFYYLDEKYKKKADKRLYVVFDNLNKSNIMDNTGDAAKDITKKEKGSFLRRIKNFFTNAK